MTPDSAALIAHLHHLTLRGLSRQYVTDRRRAIRQVAAFIGHDPLTATGPQLLAYLPTIPRTTARSRYAEISHLVQFYGWCVVHDWRTDDPTVRLPKPKLPKGLPRPMSEDNLRVAIDNADRRMRLILILAAYAGLRACEIARLHRADVLDGLAIPSLVAHGKGDKDRIVPMCDLVLAELRRYGLPARGPLFPRLDDKPGAWTPQRVSMAANLYLHSLGITDSLHSLRHRAATGWQRETGDIMVVAALLGHDSPATTVVYAQFHNDAGYRAVQALGSGSDLRAV